jgi:hypothetical protein
MFFLNLLFAFLFGLLITIVFSAGFNRKGPWNNIFTFFIIVFLATWAGGIWVLPFGPALFGVSWLPYLFISLAAGLILAASAAPQLTRKEKKIVDRKIDKEEKVKRYDIFFILIVVFLAAAIIVRYIIDLP